ncbi:MAG: c-type cytochrome [Verrucomicrobia bacterium]|nr:c-type cytochrome [Verrucomicrobiota bacterium]
MRILIDLRLVQRFTCATLTAFSLSAAAAPSDGNRLAYLDETDPFYVHVDFPKLTTPQWIGEPGIEAAVILAIDDLRDPKKYEIYLRPILERLKKIDGHAPVSIYCNALDPEQPQFQSWLKEGLSLEVHTLSHPCPLLAKGNFQAAVDTVNGGIDLLNRVPNNKAVAYRMPCCDSINSPSPRFYAEIFNRRTSAGHFLTIDSSVMNITTPKDKSLPRELVVDADGREKFRKYVPFPSFVTTIDDYPYPYVIGKLCWEFPAMAPSDWEAQHLHGTNNPVTVGDWKAALDATVLKQGLFTFIFHPHGWIRPDQMVEFIDYAVQKYGSKVKFLNFREAQERIDKFLLAGRPLRAPNGQDNGVRLIDLNRDGYLDVVIGNGAVRKTRLWSPKEKRWVESEFPTSLVFSGREGDSPNAGVKFGVLSPDGFATMLVNGSTKGAWQFDGAKWTTNKWLLNGLELDGQPIFTTSKSLDRGVRLRDLDRDGLSELVVGNETQNAVFKWSAQESTWKKLSYGLPKGASIVDGQGRDNGLRFVDLNDDGYDDAVFSNEHAFSIHLFVPKLYLGFQSGWTRAVVSGKRGDAGEIPMIVRSGDARNNGAWFHSRHLWVQNEDTAALKDLVDRRSFADLLGGLQPAAKSPQAALESMRVRPGFKIDLVAHEPLVKDPIAFEWGADGKLWVVEMGDYPLGVDGQGKSGGVVRFLEDTDSDGRYDKSTVFLDGVNFPTGVMPWRKGVLVSAAPEVFYAEDTDGDGKADLRKPILTGFREGNQQHRVNGFEYGLDNWVYGANGDSGGQIRSVGTLGPVNTRMDIQDRSVDLRGRDFRFRPDEPNRAAFQTVEGQTQFGRRRDDWGNWFGNNNPNWAWHYFMPEHYLARNPHLAVKTLRKFLANYPESTRVYAVSRSLQRFNDIGMLNHVTSGNSATPYRDDVFGPDFATSIFISEPVHNVVHREILEPDGVSFQSRRASDESDREFLASTDNWFRPIMLKTGPDGALYIADMYRLVLEHPEWIPPDTQKSFDLRAGSNLGRIYRVYPENAKLRPLTRLDKLDTAGLVKALESNNGWQRDTAQRLLAQATDRSTLPRLETLLARSSNPKARLQALCTIDGLQALTPGLLQRALADGHPAVREHAIRLCECLPLFPNSENRRSIGGPTTRIQALENALLKRVNDPSLRVRYQLAFTLGQWKQPRAGNALAALALRDWADAQIQMAILSSASEHVETMLTTVLQQSNPETHASLIEKLLDLATRLDRQEILARVLQQAGRVAATSATLWPFAATGGFLDAAEALNGNLASYRGKAGPDLQEAIGRLEGLFAAARQNALDDRAPESLRVAAMRLMGRGLAQRSEDVAGLAKLLAPQVPTALQKTALGSLAKLSDAAVAEALLKSWKPLLPALRNDVLDLLLSRTAWTEKLLAALEQEQLAAGQLSTAQRQKLTGHSQTVIRDRAQKLFAAQQDRKKVVKDYEPALGLNGDSSKGEGLFRQHCASCHRFRNEGVGTGPDLGALASKSPQVLLLAILDPNQTVETRYISYSAATKSGRELTGIITAETPTSLTLRNATGVEEVVLRNDLSELASSGLSLMPEGFEQSLKPQDLADLIAYLTNPPGL